MKKILILLGLTVLFISKIMAQPANDNPCGALTIPLENLGCEPTTVYSWTGATFNAAYGNTYCNGSANLDVWYKFIVPANGEVTARIATASTYNMCAEFYTSTSCNAGSLTIFNQTTNGFPCMYASSSSGGDGNFKNLPPGTTAYIRVYALYSNTTANADLKICISNTSTLADEPCNAGFFPVDPADPLGQSCTPYKTFSWTGATLTPAVPNPTCGVINPSNIRDVWFKARVPASGKLSVNFENASGFSTPFLALYDATACNGTYSQIYCGFYGTNLTNLTPNSIIYGRFYIYSSSAIDNGSVKLCVADFNSIPGTDNSKKVGIGIDSPFAKLDVVGTGIFRDKLTAGSDLEVRGNLIVQGNVVSRYNMNGGLKTGGLLSVDSLSFPNRLGNHLSLYGGLGSGGQYGMGIQNALLQIYSDGTSSNIAFGNGNSNAFNEVMRVTGSGRVGIGIAAPSGKLDLVGGSAWFRGTTNISHFNLSGSEDTYIRGGTAGSRVLINDIANPGIVSIGANTGIGNNDPAFMLDISNRMRIRSGGNAASTAGIWLNSMTNVIQNAFIGMGNDNLVGFFGNNGAGWGLAMNTSTANVGIGLNGASPSRPLSFPASLGEKILLYPGGVGEVGIGVYGNELRLHADNPGAKVSFGTQDNAGNFSENALAQRNGVYAFSVLGSLWVNGTTYASDERFKQNITSIQSPLQKLMQLNGVEYEMKTDEFPKNYFQPGRQIGLLAQNVEKIIPEAVNEKDGYKGVDYARLVPLLIESIKELKKEIDDLKTKQQK